VDEPVAVALCFTPSHYALDFGGIAIDEIDSLASKFDQSVNGRPCCSASPYNQAWSISEFALNDILHERFFNSGNVSVGPN
jgi:hypothetical protein